MASPEVESTLTSAQLRQYKKLQALGQEYADEYALVKAKENVGRTRAEVLSGKEPTVKAPAFERAAPEVEPTEPTYDVGMPTATTTEEEMGLTFESPFPETERERLERETRRPVEEDFIFDGDVLVAPKPITEDIGLPELNVPLESERTRLETGPVTAEENVRITPDIGLPEMGGIPTVYIPISPERAKEEPERVRAVTETETGEPQVEEATRLQTLYAKFDDAERAAYQKAKRELLQQGASLYEAEARAAQIVRGTITGPREILTAEKLAAESPELTPDYRINPEFYQSEDVGIFTKFGEAIRPKPLKSPRQVAVEQASVRRGEEQKALIDDEVTKDLVAWRNGSKTFKGENYYVYFKDPVRGGIDQEKVDAWKKERFAELVRRTEADIKATIKRDLLDAEAAKGNVLKPQDAAYKEIDTQADQISKLWTNDVAPEILTPDDAGVLDLALRTDTKLKWNANDFSFDIVKEGKGAPAFETKLGAGLRSIGGAIRGAAEPVAEFMSYEVNDKGEVLDKSDWNYGVHVSMQYAWDKIEKGTATPLDYAIAYNPFGAIASTGRTIEGTAPLLSAKKYAGIPATFGLVDGTGYFEDWAFATATGRWLGTDIAEAPVIKHYYDSRGMSYVPWIAGLTAELLLPVSSLTAAGKGVGTLGRLGTITGRSAAITGGVTGAALGSAAGPTGAAIGGLIGAGTGAGVAAAGRLAAKLPRVGEAVVEAGRFIEKPIRTTASVVGNRVGSIRLYDALLKSAGEVPLSTKEKISLFFRPAELNEVAAEGVASVIANNVVRNTEVPNGINFPEFNSLVYKGKGLDAVYDAVIKNINGEEVNIRIPETQRPLLAEQAATRLTYYLFEERGLRKLIEEAGAEVAELSGRGVNEIIGLVRNSLTERIQKLLSNQPVELTDLDKSLNAELRGMLVPELKPRLIAADLVPDINRLFAETTFNDWVTITPTTVVKTKAWQKYGNQIDAATKRILFGDYTDDEIANILAKDDNILLVNKDEVIIALENYKLKTGLNPTYVNNLIDLVKASDNIPVADFNKVADIVKAERASAIIPKGLGSAVEMATTGRLSQRAAVPLVRRATVPRAFETLERGVFGRVLSQGTKRFQSQGVFGINLRIPRTNITLANAVDRLTARINNLPNEVSAGWRKSIAEGSTPYDVLQGEIDATFNAGKVSKEQFVDDLSNIVKRFFSIPDEAKLFKENYGVVIDRLVDNLAERGAFGEKLADGTYDYNMSFEIVKDILSSVQRRFAPLEGLGLDTRVTGYFRNTLDDEGILSLLVAQSLDKRRLAIIDDFGRELLKDYPELIIGNTKAFEQNVLDLERTIEVVADNADEIVTRLTADARELGIPEGSKIGEPVIVEDVGGNVLTRAYVKDVDNYNQNLITIAAPKILADVIFTVNKPNFDAIIADAYQKVIRNISVEGSISVAELEAKVTQAFLEKFPLDAAVGRVKSKLATDTQLARIDFTDIGTLTEKEMSFGKLAEDRQNEIIADIIAEPAKYTNDVDTIAKLDEYRKVIESGDDLNAIAQKVDELFNSYAPTEIDLATKSAKELNKSIKVPKNLNWFKEEVIKIRELLDTDAVKAAEDYRELKRNFYKWYVKETIKPKVVEAIEKTESLAKRVAKANIWNSDVIVKTGKFNPELEAAISATYLDRIQKMVNVGAVDILSKLQATGVPFNIRGGDITFSDVMLRAKQLGPVSALVDNDTYIILDKLTSNNIYVERGLEGLASKNKGLANWLGASLVDAIDYVRLRTIQGMLGGYIAPTTRFFGVNDFSAPLIAAVTNPTYVSTVAKSILPAIVVAPIRAAEQAGRGRVLAGSGLTGATLGAVAGGPVGAAIGGVAGLGVGGIISKLSTSKTAYGFSDITPFITPSGKVITNTEFNSILARNKWRTSQIDFEFSDRLLAETVSSLRSAVISNDTFKTTVAHLTTLSRDKNWFNILGSESDIVFRRAVFKEALVRGLPEGQAANLSRNTLLDYTAVSEAERKYISRAILFYSFARQSLLETMMAFMREPTENAILRKVFIQRAAADRAAKEYGVELEDYQKSRLWINAFTQGTSYDGQEVMFFGIDDPMLSQFNTMLGVFGAISAYDYTNKDNSALVSSIAKWYAGKNPELDFVLDMYELNKMKSDGYFGMVPATELVALQEIGALDMAIQYYDLQPFTNMELKKLKEKYGGLPSYLAGKPTYNGQYWKFGTSAGASNFIVSKYISTRAGFQRGITDWAQMSAKTANVKNPELKRYKDGKWYLYGVGLETPMAAPDWLQIQYEIAQAQYRELQKIKQGDVRIKRITQEGE